MRKICVKTAAIVIAIALSASGIAAADPLASGKPAGVHAAQMEMGNKEWLVFGGLAVLVAAVLIANNGSGEHVPVVSQPVTVVGPGGTAG